MTSRCDGLNSFVRFSLIVAVTGNWATLSLVIVRKELRLVQCRSKEVEIMASGSGRKDKKNF